MILVFKKGYKPSDEHKRKLGLAAKGRKVSEETRRKMGLAGKGRKLSEKTRRKLSQDRLGKKNPMYGRKVSEETRRKLSLAHKGRKVSEETRRKISLAHLGMKNSEETRRKIKLANIGRKHTEESKRKIRLTSIGRKHSAESKRKIGLAHKGNTHSAESKRKISQSKKGQISAMKGKKHTAESRRKMSIGMKKRYADGAEPWNKGKTGVFSEETRRKIRAARARQVFTEETRRKRGEAVKRHIAKYGVSAEHRKKIGLAHKGKKQSEEAKRKMSVSIKKRYAEGLEPWNKGKTGIYSAEVIEKMKERRAKQKFPSKDTVPEKFLQEVCSTAGIGFYKHKNFNLGFQRHDVDLFIEPNICLEVDGDWPHANPKPFTLRGKSQHAGFKANDIIRNVSRTRKKALLAKDIWETDRRQTKALTQLGNIVIRFWQTELEQNPQKCLEKIIKAIKESKQK